MYKFAIILLNLIIASAVFAEKQQDAAIFTDQDLMKYKRSSEPDLPPLDLGHHKNESIKKNSGDKAADAQGSAVTKAKDEISESEKKNIEREFTAIVASMLSQLKAGNIEGALAFFVESRKERHRKIFTALKDNNTLKLAAEGYMGVDIAWIGDHLAEGGVSRNEDGKIYSYGIKFMETAKGVWKIYDF
ncbi:MAG: hypothetical protein EPN25_02935 [Nitrospirae bacterium]|nr:MAG: hypothetical protein EPN25_02935 [Nitrospirota bacterium]